MPTATPDVRFFLNIRNYDFKVLSIFLKTVFILDFVSDGRRRHMEGNEGLENTHNQDLDLILRMTTLMSDDDYDANTYYH